MKLVFFISHKNPTFNYKNHHLILTKQKNTIEQQNFINNHENFINNHKIFIRSNHENLAITIFRFVNNRSKSHHTQTTQEMQRQKELNHTNNAGNK